MKAAKWIGISLLVFIGMELLTRAVFPEAVYRQENFGFYPAGAGDLLPSRCFQDRGYTLLPFEIKTNRLGLRSNREYTRQKPPGVFRIAALGDSFTYGLWVNNQDTWPAQLETLLNREQFRCEVFNTGIVGFTLADEYQLLKEKAIHYDPDLVLVAFYSNDIMDFIPEMRAIFARKKAQGHLSVKEKIRFVLRKTFHHSALYCLLLEWKYKLSSPPKNKPAEAALILNDDTRPDPKLRNACLAEYLRYLDKTIRLTQERNVRLAFVFFPDYRSFEKKQANLEFCTTAVKKELERHRIKYLDLRDALRAAGTAEQLYLLPEDTHMARFGYQIAAGCMDRFLKEAFREELLKCNEK